MPPPLDLWHLLSNEDMDELTNQNFVIGSVFKFFCVRAKKEKRLILVAFSPDGAKVAFIHINTNLNINVFRTEAMKKENLELVFTLERPFLDHDSVANCSDLIIRDATEIKALLRKNPIIHIGKLSDEDLRNIHFKISYSDILRNDYKKQFGFYLY